MSFPENFDRFAGTNPVTRLSQIEPFVLRAGTDDFTINSSGQVARTTGNSNPVVYGTGNPKSSGLQSAKVDLLATVNAGLLVRHSMNGSVRNGYRLVALTNGTQARLFRDKDGTSTALIAPTVTSGGDFTGMELLSAVKPDGSVDLEIRKNGVSKGSTNDPASTAVTSGECGLIATSTSSFAAMFDNYSDNSAVVPFTITEPANGEVFEGIRLTSQITIPVQWPGSPASVEMRLATADGVSVPGHDWTVKVASPAAAGSANAVFANVPVTYAIHVEVRDSANRATVISGVNTFSVGAIWGIWGRSQPNRLRVQNADTTLVAQAGNRVSVQFLSGGSSNPAPIIVPLAGGGNGGMSSGIIAAANQWMALNPTIPAKFVDLAYAGITIDQFINDAQVGSPAWGVWTGYVTATLAATLNRVTGIIMTPTDTFESTAQLSGLQGKLETIVSKFDAILGSPRYGVMPHLRASSGAFMDAARQAMYDFALADPARRVIGWSLDHALIANADPHQANGATGNQRYGTKVGQIAGKMYNASVDTSGPRVVGFPEIVDPATRLQADITFDRDIKMPAGATINFRGLNQSTDNGVTFEKGDALTGERVSARVLRVTSATPFPENFNGRLDFFRGTPFENDTTKPAFIGNEADMEANFLSRVVTDTSGFDGGRGMPVAPYMGRGLPVATPFNITFDGNPSVVKVRTRRPL